MRRIAWSALRVGAAAFVVPRLVRSGLAGRVARVRPPDALRSGLPDASPEAPHGGPPDGPPAVAVVVPTRDEADRIAPLLRALRGAPQVAEVIVVDDGSTDATADIAAGLGARVVRAGPRPAGWLGKPWALDRGIRSATSEWVVCFDADVRPDPIAPAALVDHAQRSGLDLLSAATRADLPPAARWLHAAMLTTLVARFGGPGAGTRGRELANGQCLVARRERLIGAGGFAPVAHHLVEDVALARMLAGVGWTVGFVDADGLVEVQPARSLHQVWSGWGRSLALPGVESRARILFDAAVIAIVLPGAFVRLATRRGDGIDVALIAVRLGALIGMRRAYRLAGVAYWLSPLADPPAIASLVLGGCRRTVRWRGRSIRVPAARRPLPWRNAGR